LSLKSKALSKLKTPLNFLHLWVELSNSLIRLTNL
jgi:hypothetical protein